MAWKAASGQNPSVRWRRATGPRDGSAWPALAWVFRWVIVPGVALLLGIVGATGIGPAVAAGQGHGTRGYFVPEQLKCRHECTWLGNFVLPGARITRHGVSLDNPHGPLRLGGLVPALDMGAQGTVFPRHGARLWILLLIELIAGTVVAGICVAGSGAQAAAPQVSAARHRSALRRRRALRPPGRRLRWRISRVAR